MYLLENMKHFKKTRGLTAYALKSLGIPLTTSTQLFNGTTTDPRISVIIKLANIYNITIDDLIFKDLSSSEE